ncbi:MAG TPA: hypothetical protein VKS24_01880 [Bradyrhizobium sp.]|nr:hypothetical protein [Bradyrhizobium sp.]
MAEEAEQTSGESGSIKVEPAVSHAPEPQSESVTASAQEAVQASAHVEPPAPAREGATAEMSDAAASKPEASVHEPEIGSAEADASQIPGQVIVMSHANRASSDQASDSQPQGDASQGMFGKRRFAAVAAVVALATVAGALGGALATSAFIRGAEVAGGNHTFETSIARIDADILALKAGLENNAKLAKISDAVDKFRTAPVPPPATVAAAPTPAKEVTGSVSPPAPAAPPKTEVGRLPTVEGWFLREIANGGALIDGRRRIYEVYAGDIVPGLGRVDAIRRQDGRWVVVTSKGLIVAR